MNLPSGWHHVAVTVDADHHTALMYLDGVVVGQNTDFHRTPSELGNTPQNWLGRSQFGGDAYFDGSLDDFRIYNRALSAAEIAPGAPADSGTIAVENSSFELPGTGKIKGWDGDCSDPTWTGLVDDIPDGVAIARLSTRAWRRAVGPSGRALDCFSEAWDPAVWQLTSHAIGSAEVFELKVDARNITGDTTLMMVLYYDQAAVRMPTALTTVSLTDA